MVLTPVLALACALAPAPLSSPVSAGAGADPADTGRSAPPAAPARLDRGPSLRAVVLDVTGGDLDAREAAVLAQLIAIRVEKKPGFSVVPPAALDDETRACAEPGCLARVAERAGADFVLLPETAPFGDALVLTLDAWDRAGQGIVRDAVSVRERGLLPERIGALVDGVLAPLVRGLPAVRRPDVEKRFQAARLGVCGDARGWFFCDGDGRAVTENEFVRRYRAETRRHDLDNAEIDRDPSVEPWIFLVAGGATALGTVGATVAIGNTQPGQDFARQSDDAWIVLPVIGLSAALALIVYGAVELDDTSQIHDGTELDHVLDEATARAAVESYDDALLHRLAHEAPPPG